MGTIKKYTPFYPIHPGEILKEEIEFRKISQKDLAGKMDISYTMLNEILNGKRSITAQVALAFEATLGIEADMLVSMQGRYNLQTARTDTVLAKKMEAIRCVTAS